MTRFKKEMKKRGVRFDEDFPFLPFHVSENQYNYISLETAYCKPESARYFEVYNVMVLGYQVNRDGTITTFKGVFCNANKVLF